MKSFIRRSLFELRGDYFESADRFITNGEEITLGNIVIQAIAFSFIPIPLIRYFDSAVRRSR